MAAPAPDEPTLADYVAEWLTLCETQVQPASWYSYRRILGRYVLPHLGDAVLAELTSHELTLLYGHLLRDGGRDGQGLSLRTVRYTHGIVHKALGDACRRGLLARNPAADAAVPRRHPRRPEGAATAVSAWSAEELRAFLAATAEDPDHALWTVAAGTGLRLGELCALSWDAVDAEARLLHVRRALTVIATHVEFKSPKSARARSLSLDDHTAAALERQRVAQERQADELGLAWRNDHDLVFAGPRGKPRRPDSVSRRFRYAVRASGIRPIRFHDLRHTHATLLIQAGGVPVKVVSERLGHASVQLTLDVYAHVLPAMDADAAARFGAHLYGAG